MRTLVMLKTRGLAGPNVQPLGSGWVRGPGASWSPPSLKWGSFALAGWLTAHGNETAPATLRAMTPAQLMALINEIRFPQ